MEHRSSREGLGAERDTRLRESIERQLDFLGKQAGQLGVSKKTVSHVIQLARDGNVGLLRKIATEEISNDDPVVYGRQAIASLALEIIHTQ